MASPREWPALANICRRFVSLSVCLLLGAAAALAADELSPMEPNVFVLSSGRMGVYQGNSPWPAGGGFGVSILGDCCSSAQLQPRPPPPTTGGCLTDVLATGSRVYLGV